MGISLLFKSIVAHDQNLGCTTFSWDFQDKALSLI